MSGNQDSVDERLRKVNAALDSYERELGLNQIVLHNEGEQYFNMTHDQLRKLTWEQCGEAATVLAQSSFHLQRGYNKEVATANWARDLALRTIADEIGNYQGASAEERKQKALKGNEFANKLEQIRMYAQARSDRIGYLSSRVEFLAKTMLELQQTKRKQQYGS